MRSLRMTRNARVFRIARSPLRASSLSRERPWLSGVAVAHSNGWAAAGLTVRSSATRDGEKFIGGSAGHTEAVERVVRLALGGGLGFDVAGHPVADVRQEGLDGVGRAVGEKLDAAVRKVAHPAANRRV